MSEWQPIETIPEDQKVIIFDKYDGAFIGWKMHGIYYADTQQLSIDGDACFTHDADEKYLTHWMPLPKPPM